jgi:nucleotide-binding universal stress UspA family protein
MHTKIRLLVAVDGTPHSEKALRRAAMLASSSSYEMAVVCVVDDHTPLYFDDGLMPEKEQWGTDVLLDAIALLASEGIQAEAHLLHGRPAASIQEFAERFCPDMIVTGSRGRRPAGPNMIGSVSDSIFRSARVPMLVVR